MRTAKKIAAYALLLSAFVTGSAAAEQEPNTVGGEVVMRRLSADQYKQIIGDIFGPGIKLGGRFEPEIRREGLLAVGASRVSITASGLEQYDAIARTVAAQIVDTQHRDWLIPCKPKSASEPDESCARTFIEKTGRLLYRRPLTEQELQTRIGVADAAAKTLNNFYTGLGLSLADMLESPQFLFRRQVAEADPDRAGAYRLDAYSRASQLSFLLWNAAPDEALLTAAQSGSLNTKNGLSTQVDRLLASPRVEDGVRAFFIDMLGFDEFETLAKDGSIYPKFTAQVVRDAQEQTLRTIVDHLLTQRGDYRDLFTTRKTFLTGALGAVYAVPVIVNTPNGTSDGWVSYEYAENDPRAGILTQASFVALHSHPGRSSPTIRGKALRQILLCQKVPDPPGNINFTVVQNTDNPQFKTARERLTAHRTDPTCAGCHKLIDPMGLAMENFDSSGGYRLTENGAAIDTGGELDGVRFDGAAGLGKAVRDHPAASACLVNRLYAYAIGRAPTRDESEWVKALTKGFESDGHKFPELLRRIAISDALYRISPPQAGALTPAPVRTAADAAQSSQENRP